MPTMKVDSYFSKFSRPHFSHINDSIHKSAIMAVSKSDFEKKASKRTFQICKITDEERRRLIAGVAYHCANSFQGMGILLRNGWLLRKRLTKYTCKTNWFLILPGSEEGGRVRAFINVQREWHFRNNSTEYYRVSMKPPSDID